MPSEEAMANEFRRGLVTLHRQDTAEGVARFRTARQEAGPGHRRV
jgi:hypothetical protein